MLTNKVLVFNILAGVFVQIGIINFKSSLNLYLQSRFFFPADEGDGLNNEWTSRLVASLLEPPVLALVILISGLIIAKFSPSAR